MNQYVTGAMIRGLREKQKLTQAELAEKLFVSDKTVSKWESGKGYPDITLLEPIAKVFGVSVAELLSGRAVSNVNVSSNMLRSKFYVCPVCGNVIHTMGEAAIRSRRDARPRAGGKRRRAPPDLHRVRGGRVLRAH